MALDPRSPLARTQVWLAVFSVLMLMAPAVSHAAAFRHGRGVVIAAGDTLHDDLYAAGQDVVIEGVVDGDVIVASRNVIIRGAVMGDVLAAGSDISLSGPVSGSVRIAGRDISLTGNVTRDVVAAGQIVRLSKGSETGRDALLAGANVFVGGTVHRDVRAAVERLEIGEVGAIGGDLTYASRRSYVRSPSAQIGGKVVWRAADFKESQPTPAERLIRIVTHGVRYVIGMIILGLLLLLPFPRFTQRSLDAVMARPMPSAGIGFVVCVGLPIFAMTLFIAGLMIGGWWVGAAMFIMWFVLLALGMVVAATALGRWLGARMGQPAMASVLALMLGVIIFAVIGQIPILGGWIHSIAVLCGIGGFALAAMEGIRGQRAVPRPAS